MAYVNVHNDLSKIKTELAFGLTKWRLICFGAGGAGESTGPGQKAPLTPQNGAIPRFGKSFLCKNTVGTLSISRAIPSPSR